MNEIKQNCPFCKETRTHIERKFSLISDLSEAFLGTKVFQCIHCNAVRVFLERVK